MANIIGTKGNDTLRGTLLNFYDYDTLTGGGGNDKFVNYYQYLRQKKRMKREG
ncbi:MAG: hypothetical protein V7L04_24890 [Nostoc sp.]|uniref:hypothetical protein n=1 Tax=Nostoc sp. TaxID=1180 RepID=UPI002FF84EBA